MSPEPVVHGLSWRRGDDGRFVLPDDQRTLGWQIADWASHTLKQPDGPDAGEPWNFTDEQLRLLLWWYAVDDDARWVFRRGVIRRLKGWGKDPFAAVVALIEFIGPCRFGGWDDDGFPVAVEHSAPWVQIAAVSEVQTKNTMTLFAGLLGGKSGARALGVDLGKTIIYGPNASRIEAVTSSPRTLEGARPSLVISAETQHWIDSNEGTGMSKAIRRNLAKSRDGSARELVICNAHSPGEMSVGEQDWDAYQAIASGKSVASGLMYDSLEAPADTTMEDVESLRAGIASARGDSHWLDVDRLVAEALDPSTPVSVTRQYYLNQITAADDSYVSPAEWELNKTGDRLEAGEPIVAFFDGSRSNDHTGLVACRVSDGLVSVLAHWRPEDTGGEIPRDDVMGAVDRMFEKYRVVAFYCDMRFWENAIDTWRDTYGDKLLVMASPGHNRRSHATAWDMRGRVKEFSDACERFLVDVKAGQVPHDGHVALAQHMGNAKRSPNRYGFTIRKEHRDSHRKIDLAVCAIGARMARRDVQNTGIDLSTRKTRVMAF